MRYKTYIALMLMLLPLGVNAQRRGRAVKTPKVEEPVEDPRITQMRASTQKVTFIDSVVVDKVDFMRHIPLSPHIGKLTQSNGLGTFTNEMGDHRLATTPDTLIVATDFIANRWTEAVPVNGIGDAPAINPFLMPDGITLYFAQKGEKAIGGFDVFVTRYDSERQQFLKPENLGMPFASEANDLFYAIDEFSQIGYFVTDRRQPSGKVCIYSFIPSDKRQTYNIEAYSEEQMHALADISRIADTWEDKQGRAEALERLEKARNTQGNLASSIKGTPQQTELDDLRHQADVLSKALTMARNYYATANDDERQKLRGEILHSEQQLEMLQTEIRNKEKQIPYQN